MSAGNPPERLACLEINEFTAMVAWTSSMRGEGGVLLDETEEILLEPARPSAAMASWFRGQTNRRPTRWAVTLRPKRRRLGVGRGMRAGPARWAEAVQTLQGKAVAVPGSLSVAALDGRSAADALVAESVLMVAAPREGMEALILPLLDGLPAPMHVAPASFSLIGALTRAARLPGVASRPDVMVWDTGEFESHLILVGKDGAPACVRVPFGIEPVIEAVQAELGLRLRGAAAKLLFGDAFDFGDMAPRLAGLLASKLQPFVDLLVERAGRRPSALLSAGLSSRHRWLDAALAHQLGLEPYLVDVHAWSASIGLSLKESQADGITPCWLGLLDYASGLSRREGLFPEWQDGPAVGGGEEVILAPMRLRLTSLALAPAAPSETLPVAASKSVGQLPGPTPLIVEPESAAFASGGPSRQEPPPVVIEGSFAPQEPDSPLVRAPVNRLLVDTEDKPTRTPWGQAQPPLPSSPSALSPSFEPREIATATEFQPGTSLGQQETEPWDGPVPIPARRALVLTLLSVVLALAVVHEYRLWPLPEVIDSLPSVSTVIADGLPEGEEPLPPAPSTALENSSAATVSTRADGVHEPRSTPAATGRLLETRPAGAALLIGDLAAATSPVDVSELAPGSYPSVARLPGYAEHAFELVVEKDGSFRPTVIDLRPATGTVRIGGPADAICTLYSASQLVRSGPVPAVFDDVPSGLYRLEVVRAGWSAFQTEIEVRAGERVDVEAVFCSGSLLVETVPADAEVRGLEQVFGRTPVILEDLPSGRLLLTLRRPGYVDETVEVNLAPGVQSRVRVQLRPDDRPFDLAAVDERPEPLVLTQPMLSDELRRRGGRVVLGFLVDREGVPREISIVETTSAPLAAAVLRVAPSWRFKPARVGGEAVNVRVELPVSIPARP